MPIAQNKLLAARAPHPSSLRDATFPWKGKVQCCAHFQSSAMPIAQNKQLAARAPHPSSLWDATFSRSLNRRLWHCRAKSSFRSPLPFANAFGVVPTGHPLFSSAWKGKAQCCAQQPKARAPCASPSCLPHEHLIRHGFAVPPSPGRGRCIGAPPPLRHPPMQETRLPPAFIQRKNRKTREKVRKMDVLACATICTK